MPTKYEVKLNEYYTNLSSYGNIQDLDQSYFKTGFYTARCHQN